MALTPTSTPALRDPMPSVEATVEYMRDMTILVISQVAWYRNLCPKTEFKERTILRSKVKILKNTNDLNVNYLFKNMNGAFDAMTKHYLKSLSVNIKDEHGNVLLESYKLTYNYNNGDSPMSIVSSNCSSVSSFGASPMSDLSRIYSSTLDLLLQFEGYLTGIICQPLSCDSSVDFELHYYDNKPEEYIPPGFRLKTPEELARRDDFLETPVQLRQGGIASAFGRMSLSTKLTSGLIRREADSQLQ